MVLYQGMYNVAHFEINNNLQLYEDVLVGDEYDYKRLRKICFVSGTVYINKAIVEGSEIKGGAHVTIQDDSIFINIVPENESDGLVIGITFYLDDSGNMYAYTEKREGGPQTTIVESFNGRTGAVVPADTDYNAGLIGYNNETTQLVAENIQDAVDELAQEIDNVQDEIEGLTAENISYDNSTSGLFAQNVQRAIDELDNDVSGKQDTLTFDSEPTAASNNPVTSDGIYHALESVEGMIPEDADEINYDNSVSGLTATNTQAAIDEVNGKIPNVPVDSVFGRTGDVVAAAHDYDADQVDYDNTTSGLVATDVQGAIDEVNGKIPNVPVDSVFGRTGDVVAAAHDYDADQIDYDNTTSGLVATDVQAAIDEIAAGGGGSGVSSFNTRTGAVTSAAHDYDAEQVDYDNTTSGLVATDVQAAIDEVNGKIPTGVLKHTGFNYVSITYDGVKTIADGLAELLVAFNTYVAGKPSNYRFVLQSVNPDTGSKAPFGYSEGFSLRNTVPHHMPFMRTGGDYIDLCTMADSGWGNNTCAWFQCSTATYNDQSSDIPSSGSVARVGLEEFEIV